MSAGTWVNLIEAAPTANATIHDALAPEVFELFLVGFQARALVHRGAIPFQSEVLQLGQNYFWGGCQFPGRVKIFDSEEPLALVVTRIKVRSECSNQ